MAEGAWRVAVIGGGISGLAAAWSLVHAHGADVTVYEAGNRVGGAIASGKIGGVTIDTGAEAVLARRPEALVLASEIGLGDDLVHPDTTSASVLVGGSLRDFPQQTVFGIPTDVGAVSRTGVLDAPALARLPLDHVLPQTVIESDISVADLVGRRLGPQVVERLVGPLLGGIYAGDTTRLSLRACMPAIFAAATTERSLMAAARRVREAGDPSTPALAGIRGGVARIPVALAKALTAAGAHLRLETAVTGLTRSDGTWVVTADTSALRYDAIILAVPAPTASELLRDLSLGATVGLAEIDYASVATVTLAYPRYRLVGPGVDGDSTHGIRPGSGFLVSTTEPYHVKAATYLGQKWGWLDTTTSAAGLGLVRMSYGRYGNDDVLLRDDDDLARLAADELAGILRLGRDRPVDSLVTRWPSSLPQYTVGHLDRVTAIREAAERLPNFALCGAAYDGIGIAACIASGRAAAAQVAAPD